MDIFYSDSVGRADVPGDAPTRASLEEALAVFRGLDRQVGFMGINLDEQYVLQFAPQGSGRTRVELLDTSGPELVGCTAAADFAEGLIRAAAEGGDVFQIARDSAYEWEHSDLG